MKNIGSFYCLLSILSLTLLTNNTKAQSEDFNTPEQHFYISTVFDSASTNERVYKSYFNDNRDEVLCKFVSKKIETNLKELVEDLNLSKIRVFLLQEKQFQDSIRTKKTYLIKSKIFVDAYVSLYINLVVIDAHSKEELLRIPFNQSLKTELLEEDDYWEELKNTSSSEGLLNKHLGDLASELWKTIREEVKEWILESQVRFRVTVNEFVNIGEAQPTNFGNMLRTMIVTDFVRSDAVLLDASNLQSLSNPADTNSMKNIEANYIIDGSYFILKDQLRVDIRCIKRSYNVVLATQKIITESISVEELSREISIACRKLNEIMEADFNRTIKTISIVGVCLDDQFSFRESNKDDLQFTQEIVRATSQKIRILTQNSRSANDTLELKVLNMKVLNSEVAEYPSESFTPSEILFDLDTDYLLFLRYQDLGEKVRLSAELHSFDTERPGAAVYINEDEIDKVLINATIDTTIIRLIEVLNQREFLNPALDTISDWSVIIKNRINEIKLKKFIRKRHIGFRFGGVISHVDSDLYLGRNSGNYFEWYYSGMIPFLEFNAPGGRWDIGYEAVLGLDKSFNTTQKSPTLTNTFVNLKTTFTSWQYSNTTFNISAGSGIGVQRITFDYDPGDVGYFGEGNYLDTEFVFAYNFFVTAEFPIWRYLSFDIMTKLVPPSKTITTFENAPILNRVGTTGLTGKLGGWYITGGIRYNFY